MSDVDEIIEFLRSLKRGFDKDLFQSKLDELAYAVDTTGLDYDDFHILFKLWLNLSIPITKWTSLGTCLVPQSIIEERTVDYAFRWLLANCENNANFTKMAFLLDWLTAAMDCNCIDMNALDSGYEIFYILLSYEVLTVNVLKLVYTLSKPSDVTRHRVLQLLDYAKRRDGKKCRARQLQVLLGLFKSYRPECVPEDIPAISIYTSFKKINANLLARFMKRQEHMNTARKERNHLLWINPVISQGGRNKKAEPLVPSMEFSNIGSKQYADKGPQKTYLDFSDSVSLLQYSLQHPMSRPARLRALLCNDTGLVLLAIASDSEQAFISHDLRHLLTACFLDVSPHKYAEKKYLLIRLSALQNVLLQGIPVITWFLAQYLPLWNEKHYFGEILQLVEWISAENVVHVTYIVNALAKAYHRAQPSEQCAILRALANMYCHLVYSSTRSRHHFMGAHARCDYAAALAAVAAGVSDMCNQGLQVAPEDMRVLYSSVSSAERLARAEARHGAPPAALPRPLTLALPLVAGSAALLDTAAALILLYRQIFSKMKSSNKFRKEAYVEHCKILEGYTSDMINCLYIEEAFTSKSGYIFNRLNPQLVSKLKDLIPNADARLSLRHSLAFALYAFARFEEVDECVATNKCYFETAISEQFPKLREFLLKEVPNVVVA